MYMSPLPNSSSEKYKFKYLKYKNKYLELKKLKYKVLRGGQNCRMCTGDSCLKTIDCLLYQISQIPDSSITINQTIEGDESKVSELIIIPGFSDSSYNRNYNTLFNFYSEKLNPRKFKRVHLIKFQDDEKFSVKQTHASLFNESNEIIDPILENKLYQKCAQIIGKKLSAPSSSSSAAAAPSSSSSAAAAPSSSSSAAAAPSSSSSAAETKFTILGKSAGGGVGLFLSELIPSRVHKLLLFAPGIKYVRQDLKELSVPQSNIIVGWNLDDTKVPISIVWPKVLDLFPSARLLTFINSDSYVDPRTSVREDTQHEINSKFIKTIVE